MTDIEKLKVKHSDTCMAIINLQRNLQIAAQLEKKLRAQIVESETKDGEQSGADAVAREPEFSGNRGKRE